MRTSWPKHAARKTFSIDGKGIWTCDTDDGHAHDPKLSSEIIKVLKKNNVETCVDFGCGTGDYSREIKNNSILCDCYDGNPHTPALTDNECHVLDLSSRFNLKKKFDCVLCLEVGEHIPKLYEEAFLNNLSSHSKNMLLISWGIKGQVGRGHVNLQDNNFVIDKFSCRGFIYDVETSENLRENSELPWFKNTVMVFKKSVDKRRRSKADYVKGLMSKFVAERGPGGKQVTLSTCGCCLMEQNCYAVAAFRRFFKTEKEIKRVIELGTGKGGFSYFINEECKKRDIEFRTFESEPEKCAACEKHGFVSELVQEDPEYLGEIIGRKGRTILLVDSARKDNDVAKYVKFLKPNDVVMAHDYAYDRTFYQSVMRAKNIWRSCGSQFRSMGGRHDSLEEYRPMLFWRAAWGAFVKK